MNKTLFRSALFAIVFATAAVATSCQKEKEKEENMKMTVSHFNPADLQIEDMNAYLEGFKTKMENANAKSSTETMGIDEAAWHLSSVANHDFANIGATHDTLRFDTLYCHIDVTDGRVGIADMNAAYEEMSQAIVNFKKGLNCENPNFWFIGTKISESGDVVIPLTTMFTANCSKYWGDHYWSLNANTADSICALCFDNTTTYYADGNAMTALEYALMLRSTYHQVEGDYLTYYTTIEYKYQNYTDPYGSNFYGNSRLYASIDYYHNPISYENMCYAFDSYAGLAWTDANLNLVDNPLPTNYSITFLTGLRLPCVGNHKLTVEFSLVNGIAPPPGPGGDL